jgi:predicted DNA-binding protein
MVSSTFRFKPETVNILKNLKDQTGQSETAILENLIAAKRKDVKHNL